MWRETRKIAMWRQLFCLVGFAAVLCAPSTGLADLTPVLGSAQDYAVLGHTGVTNTGPTVVFGSATTLANVGVYEAGANAISGFSTANTYYGPGTITYGPGTVNAPAGVHAGDGPGPGTALNARNDLITAYTALATYGTATDLTGADLGNYHTGTLQGALAPGVYHFDTSVGITGLLELDAAGVDGVSWVFQIGSTLDTAAGPGASAVRLINPGGNLGSDVGVFWVVGSSATIGTYSKFEGNILALTDITVNTGATIYNGRALAQNGAVTLDNNIISDICPAGSSSPNSGPGFSGGLGFDASGTLGPIPINPTPVPLPGALLLFVSGMGSAVAFGRRFFSVS
jgi:hypothetical protein